MKKTLRSRKQDLVRDAIYDAAIHLFEEHGFDQTTVEEIAQAAGISRRSFFRYYASKDDLLAQSSMKYGVALVEAVKQCPRGLPPLEVLERTVDAGVRFTESQQHLTRQVIEIASRSMSARQAHLSRMIEVEDSLAEAVASRTKGARRDDMESRLLSGIIIATMNAIQACWFIREQKDLETSAKEALRALTRNLCASAKLSIDAKPGRKQADKSKALRASPR